MKFFRELCVLSIFKELIIQAKVIQNNESKLETINKKKQNKTQLLRITVNTAYSTYTSIKTKQRTLSGDPVVQNLPSQAGDAGSSPGQRSKTPYIAKQQACTPQLLSPWATTRDHVPQQKITHDSMKIQCAATKARQSQIK